jgi:hypothetical protein
MKRTVLLSLIGLALWGFAAYGQTDSAASADAASSTPKVCKVDSILFGTGVESRALVGASNVFDPSIRKVFCWTKISIDRAPVTVKHVWYNGTEKVFELPLRLKYASGRLWSYKTVTPGDWKVDVVNEQGEVIGSATFTSK